MTAIATSSSFSTERRLTLTEPTMENTVYQDRLHMHHATAGSCLVSWLTLVAQGL